MNNGISDCGNKTTFNGKIGILSVLSFIQKKSGRELTRMKF